MGKGIIQVKSSVASGGYINSQITQNANFALTSDMWGKMINITTSTNTITATLPTPTNGLYFLLRKADTDAGYVVTDAATTTLSMQGDVVLLWSDGASWFYKEMFTLSNIYLPLTGGTLTGNLNGATPTEIGYLSGLTSAIQTQINNINAGLSWKQSCRVATTANITLSGTQTIDGVSVIAGDRVLVKNQTTGSQNGIYVCAAGSWSRSTDATTGGEGSTGLLQATMNVEEGTTNGDTMWTCSTNAPITVGSTSLTFIKTSNNTYTAGTGLSLSSNAFSIDSTVATLTGSQTLTNKTLTASSNVIGGVTMTLGSDAANDIYYRNSSGV